ncbi:DUF732 domain-containing protein [Mycobacterium montefiorense]|uniref:DUF732 domain-containing protein n=1 Tax=Mycobacterium montefiorense TaxID=154654 RepID=A0AA37PRP4_9MYCO|nr:DUF732 domain-containing protein [Mycobacterium montefiorense]GBG36590.1 hypothetical protein MmonteBS_09620 [Mycobacterium montefiorense]GKU43155.1 hypothetical protein NJB14192_51380 [Mycobacterium montefiorense]GKU48534.1 hypothetical protein NJB14194_51490 [Mycobacterium montefiorense]GKU50564.1 hypothetical protein NJB14195_18100 [Mycobacterium montefiorense]GKU67749.1 hypothetical protein NJB18183_28960 [Mycobacterium montefiorense]
MTALMMSRARNRQTVRRASAVRLSARWADIITAALAGLRPVAVAAGIIAAGSTLPALAQADPSNDPITTALNGAGIANSGSFSDRIASIGQSICPSLVKPGATLASITSQLSGNTGLSPTIAGMVASMAIQTQCPGVMTSLAHGNMPFPMQAPGAHPFPSFPFQSPGAGAAPNPLMLPGR